MEVPKVGFEGCYVLKPTNFYKLVKASGCSSPLEGLHPHKLKKASGCSSPLEGYLRLKNSLNGYF